MTLQRERILEALTDRWAHARVSEEWKLRARCRTEDPELWFPARDGERRSTLRVRAMTRQAQAICADCPVRPECQMYSLELDLRFGIWGGLTEWQRARLTGRRTGA